MSQRAPATGATRALSIPSLDGLRAVSFLLVFVGHVWGPSLPVPGGFGVTIFFFLSGYLITTLLREEASQRGRIDLRHFYLRRVLRIWPPFYIILFTASVMTVTGFMRGKLDAPSVLSQALHYSNYWLILHGGDGIAAGTGVYWSLAVEEHFYLVFPALFLWLTRARASAKQQLLVLLCLCAATLLWRSYLIMVVGVDSNRTYSASDTRLDSILFGCCLAVFANPALDLPPKRRPQLSDLAFLSAGIAALLVSFVVRNATFRETLRYTLQGLGLYPIFITAIRFPGWGPYRLLNLRPFKYIGKISFSLYLAHQVVILILFDRVSRSPAVVAVLALGISIGVASLLWVCVEEPCAELRRQLTGARRVTVGGPPGTESANPS